WVVVLAAVVSVVTVAGDDDGE
nr:hypothetical protein [Tanacetum cinerariifolium]